jgi:hypothetical protein
MKKHECCQQSTAFVFFCPEKILFVNRERSYLCTLCGQVVHKYAEKLFNNSTFRITMWIEKRISVDNVENNVHM